MALQRTPEGAGRGGACEGSANKTPPRNWLTLLQGGSTRESSVRRRAMNQRTNGICSRRPTMQTVLHRTLLGGTMACILVLWVLWCLSWVMAPHFASVSKRSHVILEIKHGDAWLGAVRNADAGVAGYATNKDFRIWIPPIVRLQGTYNQQGYLWLQVSISLVSWLLLASVYPWVTLIRGPVRRRWRRRHGRCEECGYDLTGNVSGACSECGRAICRDREPEIPSGQVSR